MKVKTSMPERAPKEYSKNLAPAMSKAIPKMIWKKPTSLVRG
jgi:hypothetical protein